MAKAKGVPVPLPDSKYLHDCLRYDAETGRLFWRRRPKCHFVCDRIFGTWNSRYAGKEAFTTIDPSGYPSGSIDGQMYKAHRIIFKMMVGRDPRQILDHVDGDPGNNRIENLREATFSENCMNSKTPASNTSGFKGVSWSSQSQKWRAYISAGRTRRHIGLFDDPKQAYAAYVKEAKKLHGKFARLS